MTGFSTSAILLLETIAVQLLLVFGLTLLSTGFVLSEPVDRSRVKVIPFFRGTQREYSSKPLKHSIFERILVFKR